MANDCINLTQNLENCPCTYSSCLKRGKCCECISYHRSLNELPACYFPPEIEKTYDRSIERFVSLHRIQ